MNLQNFKAFELSIESDYFLPGLKTTENIADVKVKKVESIDLPKLDNTKFSFQVEDQQCFLHVPDAAYFQITNGNQILVQPLENAKDRTIQLYIIGTCLSVILNQRNIFQLHASAIDVNGKAILFAGDSGCGKSTLINTLIKRGYKLITDDVSALKLSHDSFYVLPSYPQSKLWDESLVQLEINSENLNLVHEDLSKKAVPIEENHFSEIPIEVDQIYFMTNEPNHELSITALRGAEKISNIIRFLYRSFFIDEQKTRKHFFEQASKLANQTKMFQLTKEKVPFAEYSQMIDIIQNHFTSSI